MALLAVQNWQKRLELTKDSGGSKLVKNIIAAINCRQDWKQGNDSIHHNESDDISVVRHHGQIVCAVYHNDVKVIIHNSVYRSKSTKERLNRILMRFCGCQLYQKDGEWYIVIPGEDDRIVTRNEKMVVSFLSPEP
jgi:hypothetical protein